MSKTIQTSEVFKNFFILICLLKLVDHYMLVSFITLKWKI